MHAVRPGLLALVALLLVACVRSGAEDSAPRPRRDASLITRMELEDARATNLYEHIQAHRPAWLQRRGATSIHFEGDVAVYLDHQRFGGPESLRQLPVSNAEQVRFLSPSQAHHAFGVNHPHGAIQVITRGRGG